jgi:hypothetical protein
VGPIARVKFGFSQVLVAASIRKSDAETLAEVAERLGLAVSRGAQWLKPSGVHTAKEVQHHDNNQNQTEYAAEARAAIAPVRIVTASASEKEKQHHDNQ